MPQSLRPRFAYLEGRMIEACKALPYEKATEVSIRFARWVSLNWRIG